MYSQNINRIQNDKKKMEPIAFLNVNKNTLKPLPHKMTLKYFKFEATS
jgi:hypothetical protein